MINKDIFKQAYLNKKIKPNSDTFYNHIPYMLGGALVGTGIGGLSGIALTRLQENTKLGVIIGSLLGASLGAFGGYHKIII